MISKLLLAIVFFFILPELIGLLIVHLTKNEKNNVILALIMGYIIMFGITELLAIYTIYADKTVSELINIFVFLSLLLSIVSIVVNIKCFKEIIISLKNSIVDEIKNTNKLLAIIAIALIVFQLFYVTKYSHYDEDDSYYVGAATTAVETDKLLKYNAYTGELYHMTPKYTLGAFLTYSSIISVLLEMHPAVVSHLVFPVVFISLVYIVYYLIGKEFYKEQNNKKWIFMIFISIINLWGNYSIRTSFTFFLFRIWQGKAMLASFIIPLLFLLLLKAEKNNYSFDSCLLLFLTSLGGLLTTTMAIGFIPITVMSIALSFEIANFFDTTFKTSFINLIKCLVCCIPCFLMGIAYIILK